MVVPAYTAPPTRTAGQAGHVADSNAAYQQIQALTTAANASMSQFDCEVRAGDFVNGYGEYLPFPHSTFGAVPLSTIVRDPGNHWDAATNTYVVSQAGKYIVYSLLRPAILTAAQAQAAGSTADEIQSGTTGLDFFAGANTANADTAKGKWDYVGIPPYARAGIKISDEYDLQPGDRLRLVCMQIGAKWPVLAGLTIRRIS